jgi:DUF1680 family protein
VHLYVQSTSSLSVTGQKITLKQETRYPWDGLVRLHLGMEQPAEFALNLRIPGWCRQARLDVNGEPLPIEQYVRKGYAHITRRWRSGDTITLDLPMPVERVYAHPDLVEDNGRVALQRGPLVYCLEGADNDIPLHRIRLAADTKLESRFDPALLGGVAVIEGQASALETADWADTLYRTTPPKRHAHRLVAIPYYAWDQRTPGEMSVWIREEEE